MSFFNVGILEILVILVLALILFGPQKLLILGSSLRKALTEFQRNATDFASAALDQADASEATKRDSAGEERAEFAPEDGNPDDSLDDQNKTDRDS